MSPRSGLLIVLGFTLWRVVTLNFDATDLFVDEAQYWFWSQNLDLGYYSKPPMIAWVIRAMTELSGSNAIYWIRLLGPLIHMAAALVLMKTAKRFVGPEIEGWTGATYITLPGVALSSVFFSTDVILLFFIAIALLAYFGLTQRRSVGLALVMGLGVGLAFLTKYAVLFVVPGGAIALLLIPAARIAIRDFIIAVAVAAVVALPNLWWNLQHDNTTVRHTQDIAHWSELGINLRRGLEFFAAQFGVVGPIIFFAMLWAVYRMIRGKSDDREKMLVWLSMPVVLLITLQATVAKAYANWAVTAYVAGTILAVWLLYLKWPKGLRLSLTINGIASLLFPLATIFPHQLLLPNGDALMKRYLGRAEVSREAAALATQSGTNIIVTDNRDMVADLFYTLRDAPYRIYARAPAGLPESYYEQEFALPADITGKVLFLTDGAFTCATEPPEVLKNWLPTEGNYKGKTLSIYKVSATCLAP
ncbi:ArnT family glycosyltransferase [Rhizobium laguerreae]|uniref:ArnT family glycosyltransferase n=1 Tax=Rhizobium laguerreae TaxID=1076926 RepID=UPI001C91FA5E|nr:glycosyltransferase family 39 protein [Rhizobium laguerreae]MBY3167746.1 glycosyl transferase [Rhizobium laguerreae]MBY3368846.1 glycosyl transferase [Rhizobium laguerreae]